MEKIIFVLILLAIVQSCSFTGTIEPSKRYKVYEKVPSENGNCDVYWFDEYKLRKNTVKCDSCFINQPIGTGKGELKI